MPKSKDSKPKSSLLSGRRFTPMSYRSRRKRLKAERQETRRVPVPSAFKLFMNSMRLLAGHWEVFGGLLAIFAILNLLLVGGLTGASELQGAKDNLDNTANGPFSKLSTGLNLFTFLVASGTGTTAAGVANAYQILALIVISLAIIWACRQLYAGKAVRVRDGFYQGMSPLITSILVLLVASLQLLPMLLGLFLYDSLISGGVLTVAWEQAIIALVSVGLIALSIYWVLATVFALYIVTLPGMTPLAAISSARSIVRFRRGLILRKLLFLLIALVVPAAIILVPVSIYVTIAAVPVYFMLTVVAIGVIHAYLYNLYRALIAE